MKNKIKTVFTVIIFAVILIYIGYLSILPIAVNKMISSRKSEIQNIFEKNTGFKIDYTNIKIHTTPMLSAGIDADDIKIVMPNGGNIFQSNSLNIRISLPSLLFKTLKITLFKIKNPMVNIDIVDGNKYEAVELINNLQKEQNEKNNVKTTVTPLESVQASAFDFSYKVDKFILESYKIYVNDKKTSNNLHLEGNNLIAKYDGKNIYINTDAELLSNDDKKVTAKVDIKTFIPQINQKQKEKSNPKTEAEFINPVLLYKEYDIKSDIQANLNIQKIENSIKINGNLNIKDTSIKIGKIKLPKSYLILKFNGQKFDIDTNLYIADNESIKTSGYVNYSKKPSTELNIKSDKIYIESIVKLTESIMNSLKTENNLSTLKAQGYILADAKIKTDFKKLTSNGKIELVKGALSDKKTGLNISSIKSILLLENNNINIRDTRAVVNGTPFTAEGTVDKNSAADIKIYTKNLPLNNLYETFAPSNIKNRYSVKNGLLSLNIDLKGQLEELKPYINMEVINLAVKDAVNNILLTNGVSKIDISTDLKKYKGKIQNSNLVISLPDITTTMRNEKVSVDFDETNVTINPSEFIINGTSKMKISGIVKNYIKAPQIKVTGEGIIESKVIKDLAGGDAAAYIDAKGYIPVKLDVLGDDKNQEINFTMTGTPNAYITPITLKEAYGKNSALKINAKIANNKITLKDSGLYTNISYDDKQNFKGRQLISLSGVINLDKNITINGIKISTVEPQKFSLYAFDKSDITGDMDIIIKGTANMPKINGNIAVQNVAIPKIMTKISKAAITLNESAFNYDIYGMDLNGSKININGTGILNYQPVTTLNNLKIYSEYIDTDKVIKVSEALAKIPSNEQSSKQSVVPEKTSKSIEYKPSIPIKVTSGNIDIKKLKSGDITASDITSKLTLSNDIVYLNDLNASAFDGNLKGDISMNLNSGLINLKVSGSGMNADKTVTSCAAMKNTIFGTLDFNAELSLQGAEYREQMKSLKGNADFTIKDGQFGSFGKFETFLKADNIASLAFISTSVGSLINKISPHNTSEFSKLNGKVSFNNGTMNISTIKSSGKNMSLYIKGNMNLLNNNADILILGKVSNEITSLLGPLNQLNPVNILKTSTSTISAITLSVLKAVNEAKLPSELSQIPALTIEQEDLISSKFAVKIDGNIEKPQTAVKSFKWISSQTDLNKAEKELTTIETTKKKLKSDFEEVMDTIPKTKEEAFNAVKEAGKNAILKYGKKFSEPKGEKTED